MAYLRENCVASRLREELTTNAVPLFLVFACDDLNVSHGMGCFSSVAPFGHTHTHRTAQGPEG